jgi:hypothetical protein
VFVAKEDHYRSMCQASLDRAVPAIWVDETPLV